MIIRKPILLFLFSVLLYVSCKKTDTLSNAEKIDNKSIEEIFFDTNRSTDPTEKAFVEFLRRLNNKEHFVGKIVEQIGYPRWKKAFTIREDITTTSLQSNIEEGATETYYIPFVMESQNYVDAAMVIKASESDTTFSYRLACNYKNMNNNINSLNDDAEYFAVFFMVMDKRVFGYDKFTSIDSTLFTSNGQHATKIELTSAVVSPVSGNLWDYIEFCQDVTLSSTSCPSSIPNCSIHTTTFTYTYCWGEWMETGGGGSGSGSGGNTGGTGGGGSGNGSTTLPNPCNGGGGTIPIPPDDDPPTTPDPCVEAATSATAVTTLAQSSIYAGAKSSIEGANQTVENSITFGTDASGNYTTSSMTSCTSPAICTVNTAWPGAFADMHNHPNPLPPSPGDLYELITVNNNHAGYNTRIVITPEGSTYALVILNLADANAFNSTHPSINIGYGPDFPSDIYVKFDAVKDQFMLAGESPLISEERAMAFVLSKYNTGFALLKQDATGTFKLLRTDETTAHGQTTYTTNNCP